MFLQFASLFILIVILKVNLLSYVLPIQQDKVSQVVQTVPLTISRPEGTEVQVTVTASLPQEDKEE